MELLKIAAAAWLGACIRNEDDRRKTLELFNSLGIEAEKVVKGLFQGGGIHASPVQQVEPTDEQEYI